jgi:hypothetical protein
MKLLTNIVAAEPKTTSDLARCAILIAEREVVGQYGNQKTVTTSGETRFDPWASSRFCPSSVGLNVGGSVRRGWPGSPASVGCRHPRRNSSDAGAQSRDNGFSVVAHGGHFAVCRGHSVVISPEANSWRRDNHPI